MEESLSPYSFSLRRHRRSRLVCSSIPFAFENYPHHKEIEEGNREEREGRWRRRRRTRSSAGGRWRRTSESWRSFSSTTSPPPSERPQPPPSPRRFALFLVSLDAFFSVGLLYPNRLFCRSRSGRRGCRLTPPTP
jgi:hypothetical protein